MEIGLFQLENLLAIRNQFVFLDLRREHLPPPPALKNVLQTAVPVKPESLKDYLVKEKIQHAQPVILVCEDGRTSREKARDLEAAGYSHIYTVAGGVVGLLSEL